MPIFARLDPPTRIRLSTTLSATADYIFNVLVLCAFAAAGTVTYDVPLIIALVAVILNVVFIYAIASGLTLRLRDPSITGAQVTAACAINLLGLFLAPQIVYMFLVNLFVPLSFGSLHFTRRGFLFAWFTLTVSLTVELLFLGDRLQMSLATPVERWLCCIVLALALARFMAINAAVSRLRAHLHKKNKELAHVSMQLAEHATHDELTGVWNRRQFIRLLQDEIDRTRRNGSGFCVAVADADFFDRINTQFGEQVGDDILVRLARLIEASLRSADRIARYGGEEFCLLMVDTKPGSAAAAAERIRRMIEEYDWSYIRPGLQLTISIGIAHFQGEEETHATILTRANAALSKAKNAGRNQVAEAID